MICRYDDEEDNTQLSEGSIARSQGADLAVWLEQNVAQDPTFFTRQSLNLNEEIGLPPAEGDTFQGLSFDLKGLGACLAQLPLHEVLKLPPSMVGAAERLTTSESLEDLIKTTSGQQTNQEVDTTVLSSVPEESISRVLPQESIPSRAEQRLHVPRIEQMNTGVGREENEVKVAKPLVTPQSASGNSGQLPRDSIPKPVALDSVNDDELDALLGLGSAGAGPVTAGHVAAVKHVRGQVSNPNAGEDEDSLEAWLDAL